MKILLSAFSFAPHQGSEPGVGWRWAQELAREHEVTVITDATRRAAAEAELERLEQPRLTVIYHRPRWLRRLPLNSRTAQGLYALWQFSLPALVRRLNAEHGFDLAMHITYGVFRHPSFVGGQGIPFIFGPLGGGEDAPRALKRSIRGKERSKETLRSLANRLALFDPFLWWALSRSDLILVKTSQTRTALPWPFRRRAVEFQEIGIDAVVGTLPVQRKAGEPLRAMFAGRLVGWKAVHLALMAVARARALGHDVTLDIIGRGPYEAELRKLHARLDLGDSVRFLGQVPQSELFALYGLAHVFLFPSLHDSSGNVVLEAQAHGCPVICLDRGGPATLVSPHSACLVSTIGADEQRVAERLADAIAMMMLDEPRRAAMGLAAQALVRDRTWASRVAACLDLARERGLIRSSPRT